MLREKDYQVLPISFHYCSSICTSTSSSSSIALISRTGEFQPRYQCGGKCHKQTDRSDCEYYVHPSHSSLTTPHCLETVKAEQKLAKEIHRNWTCRILHYADCSRWQYLEEDGWGENKFVHNHKFRLAFDNQGYSSQFIIGWMRSNLVAWSEDPQVVIPLVELQNYCISKDSKNCNYVTYCITLTSTIKPNHGKIAFVLVISLLRNFFQSCQIEFFQMLSSYFLKNLQTNWQTCYILFTMFHG